jgi:hypothetical protein
MTVKNSNVVERNTIDPLKLAALIHKTKDISPAVQSNLLVPLAKSTKLASIHKQSQQLLKSEEHPTGLDERTSPRLDKKTNGLLLEAQKQITILIEDRMALYPSAKKNKMFSPESIKQLSITKIFSSLRANKPQQFIPIENLNFFGNQVNTLKKPKFKKIPDAKNCKL